MKCPKCKEEIMEVFVISEYTQRGRLEMDFISNEIIEYENVDSPIGQTLRILCPICFGDITGSVREP